MAVYYGNQVRPRANSVNEKWWRDPEGAQARLRFAQPFGGRGRYITGVYWYFTSTAGLATTAATIKFGLYGDSAGVPKNSGLRTSTARRGFAKDTLYYIPFPTQIYCTAGTKYWVSMERSGTWSASRGYNFDWIASSVGSMVIVGTPDSTNLFNYHVTTSDASYTDAKYNTLSLTSFTTKTGYRLPLYPAYDAVNRFHGQPYKTSQTFNSYIQKKQKFYYTNPPQTFGSVGLYVSGKIGNPKPLTVRFEKVYDSSVRTASVTICSTATYALGWNFYNGATAGFATAGWAYMVFSTGYSISSAWYIDGGESQLGNLSFNSTAGQLLSSAKQDLCFRFIYSPEMANISGTITEFSKGSAVPGTKVKIWAGASLLDTQTTDNSGQYSANYVSGQTLKLIPEKYDWEFTPSFATRYASAAGIVQNFVQSSESVWWGHSSNHHGKSWAFRQRISFATPHPTLPVEHLADIPVQTGNMIRIASSGYFNEAIQHSMCDALCYSQGKTFVAWINAGKTADICGATYDWLTDTWTNHGIITAGFGDWYDTHFYPNIWTDNAGYIYMCKGGHNEEALYVLKSTAIGDMTTFDKGGMVGTVPGTTQNTYPMVQYDKNKDCAYMIYRKGAGLSGGPTFNLVIRKSDGTYSTDNPFLHYNKSAASIYNGGFRIDRDGVLHCAWNMFDAYRGTNVGYSIGYAYSPKAPGSTAGNYWYNIWGHTVSTGPGIPISSWTDGGTGAKYYSPYIVYSWSSAQTYLDAPRYFHSNTGGMAIHPTKTINNGKHIIHAPYFTFHAYPRTANDWYNINNVSNGYVCFFDSAYSKTSAPATPWPINGAGRALNGWVFHTVTSTAISGSSNQILKGRHYGSIMIDNAEILHIYGVVRPLDYQTSDYWSGELWEWYSQNGHTFKIRQWTDKSAKGAGMTSFKSSLSNDAIEGVYCRGNDIIYISDTQKFPRMKENGNDIRIVYGGASSKASEINSLGNFYNYAGSHVYFPIQRELNKDWTYDTAGNYYLYYGRYDTAQVYSGPNPDNPYRNPSSACIFFDNFEQYQTGSLVSTVTYPGYALNISTSNWQYVKINNHTVFNFTATTIAIECWIKTTNQNNGYIVSKPYSVSSPTGVEWGVGVNAAGNIFMRIGGSYFAQTSNPVDDGNWHHVAFVADGTNWVTYVNSALDNIVRAAKPSNTNSLPVYIGSDAIGNNRFGGTIDALRLYRVLSIEDIGYLHNSGNGQYFNNSTAIPLAGWHFDNNLYDYRMAPFTGENHSATFVTGKLNSYKWQKAAALNISSSDGIIADFREISNLKIYSGYKALQGWSPGGATKNRIYIPPSSNIGVRVGHWHEAADGLAGVRISHQLATSEQFVELLLDAGSKQWNLLSSPWCKTATVSRMDATTKPYPSRMHEYIFHIHSTNGVTFQMENGQMPFANNIVGNQGYGIMNMHTVTKVEFVTYKANIAQYFDFLRVYKTFSTPSPYEIF